MIYACKRFVRMYPNVALMIAGALIGASPLVGVLVLVYWYDRHLRERMPISPVIQICRDFALTDLFDFACASVALTGATMLIVGVWRALSQQKTARHHDESSISLP